MSLTYIDWEVDGVTVLNLSGRFALGDGTRIFRQLIQDMLDQGKKKLALNLAEVFYIDSSGLGELVSAHTRVVKAGGKLKVFKISGRAHDLFQMTKLYMIFEIYDDEHSAVRSFRSD